MRLILTALIFALTAQNGMADSLSSDVTSLNYYPHHGHLAIEPEFSGTMRDEGFSSANTQTYTKAENLILNANYGIAHRLRLGVAETLTTGQSKESVSAKGLETDSTADGFSNPTVTLAWRIFDARSDGLSGDLSVDVSPNFGDKGTDNGAAGHEGNQLAGNWSDSAGASLFWRIGISEAELHESYTHNYTGHTDGAGDSTTYLTRPYSYLTSNLYERLHFGSNAFIQFGITVNSATTVVNIYDTQVTKTTQSPTYSAGRLSLGYRLKKNSLLDLGATWHKDSTLTTSSAGPGSSNQTQEVVATLSFLHQI
jgi:hypothetical protein